MLTEYKSFIDLSGNNYKGINNNFSIDHIFIIDIYYPQNLFL